MFDEGVQRGRLYDSVSSLVCYWGLSIFYSDLVIYEKLVHKVKHYLFLSLSLSLSHYMCMSIHTYISVSMYLKGLKITLSDCNCFFFQYVFLTIICYEFNLLAVTDVSDWQILIVHTMLYQKIIAIFFFCYILANGSH